MHRDNKINAQSSIRCANLTEVFVFITEDMDELITCVSTVIVTVETHVLGLFITTVVMKHTSVIWAQRIE